LLVLPLAVELDGEGEGLGVLVFLGAEELEFAGGGLLH